MVFSAIIKRRVILNSSERKKNAIKRVNEFLTSTLDFKDPGFIQSNKFNETTKKDDLADSFLMAFVWNEWRKNAIIDYSIVNYKTEVS